MNHLLARLLMTCGLLAAAAVTTPQRSDAAAATATDSTTAWHDAAYPLTTCPVSGESLGSMGDPHVASIGGREVRFCCSGCVSTFAAESTSSFARLDSMIIAEQRDAYPLTVCLVSGEPLDSMGGPVERVYRNQLVRLCCPGCVDTFEAKEDELMERLGEAYSSAGSAAGKTGQERPHGDGSAAPHGGHGETHR